VESGGSVVKKTQLRRKLAEIPSIIREHRGKKRKKMWHAHKCMQEREEKRAILKKVTRVCGRVRVSERKEEDIQSFSGGGWF